MFAFTPVADLPLKPNCRHLPVGYVRVMIRLFLPSAFVAISLSACSLSNKTACVSKERAWPLGSNLTRGIDPVQANILVTQDGLVRWNKTIVSQADLKKYIQINESLVPSMPIILSHHPQAPCQPLEAVRWMLDKTQMCQEGRCGEQRAWERIYGPLHSME